MRGTILLVDESGRIDTEHLRAHGLMVYEASEARDAVDRLTHLAPDVIVVAPSADEQSIADLRGRADHATSIIVLGSDERERARARASGADAFLSPSADLLYEIHKALILRRSGRRLPWNR